MSNHNLNQKFFFFYVRRLLQINVYGYYTYLYNKKNNEYILNQFNLTRSLSKLTGHFETNATKM